VALVASVAGCVGPLPAGSVDSHGNEPAAGRQAYAKEAVAALQSGHFDEAERLARDGNAADDGDPYTHLVTAIVRYKKAMHQLSLDGRAVLGGLATGALNQKYLTSALGEAESELEAVEKDLAIVARHSGVAVELCLACWEIDWNGNGRVDDRDRLLLQIEQDERGEEIPEEDPRRKPTFRFDDGDVAWARAFVAFNRAAVDVLLAYDFTQIGSVAAAGGGVPDKIVIKLVRKERIDQAKQRILEGLAQSDASRRAYLAETDDDREWVPNPRQRNHPMPLPMDAALYDTWAHVVLDAQRLVEGEEGLSVADVFTLANEKPRKMPRGYLDIGSMLAHPKDIVLDLRELDALDESRDVEGALKSVLGRHYVASMKPSPLTKRLIRMKGEIDTQEGELERKLRYLFWIN
jgi:hypothetical protein